MYRVLLRCEEGRAMPREGLGEWSLRVYRCGSTNTNSGGNKQRQQEQRTAAVRHSARPQWQAAMWFTLGPLDPLEIELLDKKKALYALLSSPLHCVY